MQGATATRNCWISPWSSVLNVLVAASALPLSGVFDSALMSFTAFSATGPVEMLS